MSTPPGGLTKCSPGQTDRVKAILARQSQPATDQPDSVAVDVVSGITVEQARELTDEIKTDAGALWDKVVRAYTERASDVLGYESWDTYCAAEFGSLRGLRLPLEERQDVVCSLRDAGMSTRTIASVTGASQSTVSRDLRPGESNDSPDDANDSEPAPPTNKKRRRAPFPDQFGATVADLRRDVEKLETLAGDDRFRDFARSELGVVRRTSLLQIIAVLQAMADQFPETGSGAT